MSTDTTTAGEGPTRGTDTATDSPSSGVAPGFGLLAALLAFATRRR